MQLLIDESSRVKDPLTDRRLEEARRATVEHLRRKHGAALPDPYERFASIEAARARDRDAQLLSTEAAPASSLLPDAPSAASAASLESDAGAGAGAGATTANSPASSSSPSLTRSVAIAPADPLLPSERAHSSDALSVAETGFSNREADRFLATMPEFSTPAIRYQLLVSGQRFIGRSFARREAFAPRDGHTTSGSPLEPSTASSNTGPPAANVLDAESSALKEELASASASFDTRPLEAVLRARDEARAREQRAADAARQDVEVDEQLLRDLKRWARVDESVTAGRT